MDTEKQPGASGPEIQTAKEIKAESHPDLVKKYQLFNKTINPQKKVIYHPCGANDVSPSIAFPDSKVIYVDIDKQAVETLQKEGFEAHHASALEYNPGDVDILIMRNPQISSEVPASHVRKGGYIISNDYHSTASEIRKNPDFQLRGLIRSTKERGLIYDTESPEDYWKEIDTEEEFIKAPLNWGAVNYTTAVPVVEALTGKKENVLAEYKKIIHTAREQLRQENTKTLVEHPEWADFITDPDHEDILMLNHKGRQFVLPTRLPSKKGVVDDLFVFERVVKNTTSK